MKKAIIAKDMTILRKVPPKKPMTAPVPDRNAFFISFPVISSPIKAPKSGPKINPQGAKKMPTIAPTKAPINPSFEAPNFFEPMELEIYSITTEITVNIRKIIIRFREIIVKPVSHA